MLHKSETMQKKTLILALLGGIVLAACDHSKSSQESEAPTEETVSAPAEISPRPEITYSYETKVIEGKDQCTTPPCAEVSIAFPEFTTNAASKKFNHLIQARLSSIIEDYVLDAKGNESLDDLIDLFMASYQDFKKNFPESNTPWNITADIIVTFTAPEFISMSINTSSYTGGAHPNASVVYMNIGSDGTPIEQLSFFITSAAELETLVEEKFRKEHRIGTNESLSEKGYSFENDEFALTDNFGFTKEGIVFCYNAYEIASYAEGPITVSVSFDELKELYKFRTP